jgi:hypothetical protein
VICEQCGLRPATNCVTRVTITSAGNETHSSAELCTACWSDREQAAEADRAAAQRQLEARVRDGTFFEELRQELTASGGVLSAAELVQAAEYLDLVATAISVPLPADLQAFADRHRAPAA